MLEAVVAVFIILVGLVSALVLILSSILAAGSSKNELVASNLAREAIEVVRSKRDANWLATDSGTGTDWDEGLDDSLEYRAVLNFQDDDSDPATYMEWSLLFGDYDLNSNQTRIYYMDRGGYRVYNQYDDNHTEERYRVPINAQSTNFRRLITTKPICYDPNGEIELDSALIQPGEDCASHPPHDRKIGIQVYITIQWTDKDKIHQLTQEDRIYNWK